MLSLFFFISSNYRYVEPYEIVLQISDTVHFVHIFIFFESIIKIISIIYIFKLIIKIISNLFTYIFNFSDALHSFLPI